MKLGKKSEFFYNDSIDLELLPIDLGYVIEVIDEKIIEEEKEESDLRQEILTPIKKYLQGRYDEWKSLREMRDNKTELETNLRKIVVDYLGVEPKEVKLTSNFDNDLGADSLDNVEVCMAVEEQFGIELPDERMEKVRTFGDLVKLVKEVQNA